jgi:3-hydroxy acid dehydrogenase / malonic semialdehyde reductase
MTAPKKTVCITGATSGFGEACAKRFYKEGWRLILLARRKQRLETLRTNLGGKENAHILPLDIQDRDAVMNGFDSLPAPFSDIDVLVNNAGLGLGLDPIQESDPGDWDTMVDTNIKGLLYCTRMVVPQMVRRGRGHIVNIGSVAGSYAFPKGGIYGATKSFVKHFSRNLSADLHGTRVRVSNIEPGMAKTEFGLVRFRGDTEKAAQYYAGADLLTSEDITEAVFWVVSQPEHVNIASLEIMPTDQTWGPMSLKRE